MFNSKGLGALYIFVAIFVVAVLGLGYEGYHIYNQAQVNQNTPLPTASVTPQPSFSSTSVTTTSPSPKTTLKPQVGAKLIDCIGPDGKHSQKTQVDCDAFLKAWATPTPSPTSATTQSSSGCDTSTDLGNLTVNIQPAAGSVSGDAGVTMSNGNGACAGNDSRLPYVQVIHQGSTSVTFSGYRPGKFHIDVSYHGVSNGYDVSIHSGDNSLTATVGN